jgi:DNA-binding MarR family transcriptional regulator
MRGRRRDSTTADMIYAYLERYIHEHGHPPTQAQIAKACNLSKTSVARGIDKLEAWGYVERERGTYRSLRLHEREGWR